MITNQNIEAALKGLKLYMYCDLDFNCYMWITCMITEVVCALVWVQARLALARQSQ